MTSNSSCLGQYIWYVSIIIVPILPRQLWILFKEKKDFSIVPLFLAFTPISFSTNTLKKCLNFILCGAHLILPTFLLVVAVTVMRQQILTNLLWQTEKLAVITLHFILKAR